jgi:hypothetical protein
VALGVPGRLRPRIFSTFGTTRVVGRQPYAPAAFTPGEIRGTHFQRLSRPQGTWFCRKEPRKKSQVTPSGIDSGTAAQRLNHYATPGPTTTTTTTTYNNNNNNNNNNNLARLIMNLPHEGLWGVEVCLYPLLTSSLENKVGSLATRQIYPATH